MNTHSELLEQHTAEPAAPEAANRRLNLASSLPASGRQYWRSLDHLADTPEFRQWLEREFPEGASEWTDPVSRRHFVKIMSASFLLGGLGLAGSGCRRPEERILPFSQRPEGYVYGVPQYFATAMPTRTAALPLVVKSYEGRPIKVEGNPLYPESPGATDRYAQASILNLYDPDRATAFLKGGSSTTPEAAFDFLRSLSTQAKANGGRGLAFLVEPRESPSWRALQEKIRADLPNAQWYAHDPVDADIGGRAASLAAGQPVRPHYHLKAAKVILSLDSDFLGSEEDITRNIHGFAQGRKIEKPADTPNRLYVVEGLVTLTGFAADHRLRLATSEVAQVAAAVGAEILKQGPVAALKKLGLPGNADPKWIVECARDLQQHRGASLVLAGHRQPLAVHLLALAMNEALGNFGKTIEFLPAPASAEKGIDQLAKALNAGEVETLVILGPNPVYTAPADLEWAQAQAKAKTVVRLGYYEDETAALCHWHLPAAHYLESWGDARTSDGTVVPVQPLIAPLFGGLTEIEVLARIAGLQVTNPYELARLSFSNLTKLQGLELDAAWKKFLHDGFLLNSAAKPVDVKVNPGAVANAIGSLKPVVPSKDALEVVFHRDYSLDDGRYNNNGWLQELPDPITKMVWDNAVLISRKTARRLEVENSDVVEIKLEGRSIWGPIWIQPGLADYTIGLALGYGRERSGRVGQKVGFNVYPLRTTAAQNFAVGARLKKTGERYPLACTQDHWALEGRPIIREANLKQYREHPDFARRMDAPPPPVEAPLYPNPFDKLKQTGMHQWGMAIDLNMCVGCSACMVACQSENNVPIVGKDQVKRGREMHWLRIDRYYAGKPDRQKNLAVYRPEEDQQHETWIDDPQVVTQPMLCQHCEAAPCESVCPVNATVHDQEGLNVMVYNRCVGTRYCSNNCPYKVRRFNYFDYNKRPITALYKGPLGHRKDDEWDLIRMIKNPDVTVRMRGIMEKCTFCVQRIESAKIAQKVKARASGDVVVPEGTFTTACAQACPAGAIVFGNLNDADSRVAKLKQSDRNYAVLDFLLTKPRLTYLARVRNPNPAMPDYYDMPLSFENFQDKMGNPFQSHGGGHEGSTESRTNGAAAHASGQKGAH